MAIQFNGPTAINRSADRALAAVTRNTQPVTRDVTRVVNTGELALRVDALEREVAGLRKLIADQAAPSTNKRAAYMREYRKRTKS